MIESKIILKELRTFVKRYDTNKLAAQALKVTPSQLSTTLNGSVNVIPEKILKRLGYKSQIVYLPLKKPTTKAEPKMRGSNPTLAASAQKPQPPKNPPPAPTYDAYLAGIQAKTEARQREAARHPASPVIVGVIPAARNDEGTFFDINSKD